MAQEQLLMRVQARLVEARRNVTSLQRRRVELEKSSVRPGQYAFDLARLRGTTQFAVDRVRSLEAERARLLAESSAARSFGELPDAD